MEQRSRLAHGREDTTVRVWSVETGRLLKTLATEKFCFYSVVFEAVAIALAGINGSGGADEVASVLAPNDLVVIEAFNGWICGGLCKNRVRSSIYQQLT